MIVYWEAACAKLSARLDGLWIFRQPIIQTCFGLFRIMCIHLTHKAGLLMLIAAFHQYETWPLV